MSISSTESAAGALFPRLNTGENTKTASSLFASRLERLMDQGLLKQDPETQRQRDIRNRNDEQTLRRDDVRSVEMKNAYEKSLDATAENVSRYDKRREQRADRVPQERLNAGNDVAGKSSPSLFRPQGTSPELSSASSGDIFSAFASINAAAGSGTANQNREGTNPEFDFRTKTQGLSLFAANAIAIPENGVNANALADVSSGRSAVAQGPVTMPVSTSSTLPSQVVSGAAALTIFSISGKVLEEDRESETTESSEPDDTKPEKTAKPKKNSGLFADILRERSSPRHVNRSRKDVGKDTGKMLTTGATASVLSLTEDPSDKNAAENKSASASRSFTQELAEHALSAGDENPSDSSRVFSRKKSPAAEFDETFAQQHRDARSGETPVLMPFPAIFTQHGVNDDNEIDAKICDGDTDETNTEADATRSQRNALLKRVVAAVQASNERRGPIRIRLHPESLGSVAVNVHVRENGLSATLFTATEEARRAILDNVAELKNRLARLGVSLERFEVFLMNDMEPPTGTPTS